MSGSSASPIVSRSTSFSFRASGSAMPWLSLRWRTASGSSVPAAAEEPSRLRPKRAPSSSAQSISFSVTSGVSPLCPRSTSSAAQRPRQPSSQPPCGTASMCEPTTTIFSLSPGIVAHRFPATSRSTVGVGLGQLAEQPLARRAPVLAPRQPARAVRAPRQLRQLVQVLERPLPVEVRHARHDRRNSGARAGFFCRMIRWRRIIGVSVALFALHTGAADAASPYARAVLVSCDKELREAVFEGRVVTDQARDEDAAALHAAGRRRRTTLRWRKVDARRTGASGSPRRRRSRKYTYSKTVQDLLPPANYRAVVNFRWKRPAREDDPQPSGRPRWSAGSPTRGRTSSCATCASRAASTSRWSSTAAARRRGRSRSTSSSTATPLGTRARSSGWPRRRPSPRCCPAPMPPGTPIEAVVDPRSEVDEADEENDSLSAVC